MTKLAFLSDVHLSSQSPVCRKDDLRARQWEKLNFIYNTAVEEGCLAVVVAGDFVDVACSWALLPDLAEFLNIKQAACDTWVVYGQHDTYMYDAMGRRKTIVGSLAAAGLIRVLSDSPTTISAGDTLKPWAVYGASYGSATPEPITPNHHNILVAHASITDQALWKGQSYLDASRFLKDNDQYELIVVGDIHRPFDIANNKRRIINTGPLLRRSADEADLHPHIYILDLDKPKLNLKRHDVPHPKAADVINREHLDRTAAYDALIDRLRSAKEDSAGDEDIAGIKFTSILNEVAAANYNKITKDIERIMTDITGVRMEVLNGNKKAARSAKPVRGKGNQPKGHRKDLSRAAGETNSGSERVRS